MNSIILFLFQYIHLLHEYIYQLLLFIMRTNSFRQWRHEELHSPKYQRFKTDELPIIKTFHKQDYKFLIEYYFYKYNEKMLPIKRRSDKTVDQKVICPRCSAPHHYLYNNNGDKGQYLCKVCNERFRANN
jgi:hypothetical protein